MAKSTSRVMLFGASASSRSLATATATKASFKDKRSTLYRRLAALGGTDANVAETLNEWVTEVKSVKKYEIIGIVNQLRNYKNYKHALQILGWLEETGRDFSNSDHAIRLDLLSKVEGIDSAEKYFMSLQECARSKLTYGALLNCYCKEKLTGKAMALLEKMRELNFASTPLAYNNVMSLYMRVGEPEKVPALIQEMKEKDITPDVYSYNFLMNSYASLKDINGAERVMEEMKVDGVKCDWSTYANLASIYVKAGLFDKANSTLEELEKMDKLRESKAYHILIGLYARTSNKFGVNRVWQSLKSAFSSTKNMSYLAMLQALSKLGDTDGLKKCFEEWESGFLTYDIRVTNVLINSYLSQDMIKEAELLCESAKKRGAKPNFRTLEMFMNFYLNKRQMDLALKYLENAGSKAKDWQPSQETLSTFLNYFEEEKDVDSAEKFCKSMKKLNCLNSKVYSSLLRTYVAAGKMESHMRQRMKEDGIEMSSETQNLLGRVCPQ